MKRPKREPGKTQTVRFALTMDDLAFFGPNMKRIVEPGHFHVAVGTSSADVQTTSFRLTGEPTPVPLAPPTAP